MWEELLKMNGILLDEYYKAYDIFLNEHQSQALSSPLQTFLSEEKISWLKAGLQTYLKRICWPKGIYYWKGVGMNSMLFGHKEEIETYINYFREIDTLQALYTVILIMNNWLKEVVEYKHEKA